MSPGALSERQREEPPTAKPLVAQVVETLLTRGFTMLVTLGVAIAVARALGPEGRGLYVVTTTVGMLGVQLANLGLFSSSVYYLAREPGLLRVLVGNGLVASAVLGSIAAGMVLFLDSATQLHILPGATLSVLALVWIPIGLFQLLLQSLLLGLHDVRGYNTCDAGARAATAFFTAVVLLAGWASAEQLAAAAIAGLLVGAVIAYRRVKPRMRSGPLFAWAVLRTHMTYGARAYATTLFGYIVSRCDVLAIQQFLGAEPTGMYSVALAIADVVYMLPVVVAAILFPRLSALPDAKRQWQLTRQATVACSAALAIGLLAVYLLAGPAVNLLFGAQFAPAAELLRILLPGVLFLGIETMVVQYLNARGFPAMLVALWLGAAMVKCALLIVLVPAYGLVAAALVTTMVSLLLLIAVSFLVLVDVRVAAREATA